MKWDTLGSLKHLQKERLPYQNDDWEYFSNRCFLSLFLKSRYTWGNLQVSIKLVPYLWTFTNNTEAGTFPFPFFPPLIECFFLVWYGCRGKEIGIRSQSLSLSLLTTQIIVQALCKIWSSVIFQRNNDEKQVRRSVKFSPRHRSNYFLLQNCQFP